MFNNVRGRKQMNIIDDPLMRKGVKLWLERVLGFYGPDGGVDVEIIDGQLILNEKTVDYIYSAYTPLKLKYKRGSRPMLEQVVKECVKPGMSEREKALALMRRVRDNRDRGLAKPWLFCGGSEEDLLKRGALMCNEVSRIYVCLCQIAGLPARVFCAHISGHMMTEVYAGGKWQWIDPMKGFAPVNDKNKPASAWELHKDPALFERQPRSVWNDIRPPRQFFSKDGCSPKDIMYTLAASRDFYFHPKEAMAVGNYFAWDFKKYTYPWRVDPYDQVRLEEARCGEAINHEKLGWPAYYFDYHAFNERLKPRKG